MVTGVIKKIIRLHSERSIIVVIEGETHDYFLHLKPGMEVEFDTSPVDPTRAWNLLYTELPDLTKKGIL